MESITDYKKGDSVKFRNKHYRIQDDKNWLHIIVTENGLRKKRDLKEVLEFNDLETVEGWQRLYEKNILNK